MECADYVKVKVKPAVFCVQPPKEVIEAPNHIFGQPEEDIEADNLDFYGSSDSESSYEKDPTDYTSTWTIRSKPADNSKAAFLARFSEDDDGTKTKSAENPRAAFLARFSDDNEVSKETKTTSTAKWLEVSAETQNQENVSCDSAEN